MLPIMLPKWNTCTFPTLTVWLNCRNFHPRYIDFSVFLPGFFSRGQSKDNFRGLARIRDYIIYFQGCTHLACDDICYLVPAVFLLNVSLCIVRAQVNSKWFGSLCLLGIMYGVIHFEIQREIVACVQMRSSQVWQCRRLFLSIHLRKRKLVFLGVRRNAGSIKLWREMCLHTCTQNKSTPLENLNIPNWSSWLQCQWVDWGRGVGRNERRNNNF